MKKICVLAALFVSLFGADTSWMSKWKSPSTDSKATQKAQRSAKSVKYYRQNPAEAWNQLAMCEDTGFAEMDGNAWERKKIEDFYKSPEGKVFQQECDNASESVGVKQPR